MIILKMLIRYLRFSRDDNPLPAGGTFCYDPCRNQHDKKVTDSQRGNFLKRS